MAFNNWATMSCCVMRLKSVGKLGNANGIIVLQQRYILQIMHCSMIETQMAQHVLFLF